MKQRIADVVGEKAASRIWMGTFHSVFLRILRRHTEEINYRPGFTIYDATDSRSLVKMIVKQLGLDEKQYKAATVASIISNAKNAMMTPAQYERNYQERDSKQKRPMIGKIYAAYVERCKAANAMDFDDILFNMNLLLRDNPDVCRHYREFFRYILVDEYQDTNFAQHLVVSQLAQPDNTICVVGDDAQSIYSFRGANIGNILQLEKSYPGLRTFKLERNYRSTKNIVNAASSLIARNTYQLHKEVYSENPDGTKVEIVRTYSDLEEAHVVVASISNSKYMSHDSFEDYAVLYRTNAQSRVLEEALRKRNMAYRIVGGTSFYQRKEIKDAICYFRVAVNPDDDEALRRIINFPARGIGDTTLRRLLDAATKANVSIWRVITNPDIYPSGVNGATQRKLDAFAKMIQEFVDDCKQSTAYELGQLVLNRTGMMLLYAHDNTPESISRQENLAELLNGLKDFTESRQESGEESVGMTEFLAEVSLATDADEKEDNDEPKVTLMTVHAAKGLEFKHVYIVGAEEELFPSAMSMDSIAQIEEERRLMYVAITRAKESCTISYAKSRFRNGQTVMSSPSRFIAELDPRYIMSADSKNKPEESFTRSSYTPLRPLAPKRLVKVKNSAAAVTPQHSIKDLAPGTRILHPKLGKGTVTATGNVSGEPSITVNFDRLGEKKLLLKFAKFEIIEDNICAKSNL